MNIRLLLIVSCIASSQAYSVEVLSKLAVYHRCHTALTLEVVDPNDSNIAKIKSGSLDPINACINLLNAAKYPNGGTVHPNGLTKNSIEIKVLNAFHRLHASWFSDGEIRNSQTATLLDPANQSAYYTTATFADLPISYAWTTNDDLQLIRNKYTKSGATPFPTAPHVTAGSVLGTKVVSNEVHSYTNENGSTEFLPIRQNIGGGFLGTSSYHMTIFEEYVKTDGAVNMPRKWGKNFFHDVLCRELPVVRSEDAISYVVEDSPASFRQQGECIQCHVSMDRVSSAIRSFHIKEIDFFDLPVYHPQNMNASEVWPAYPDQEYAFRPPQGVLYFRSFTGELIEKSFSNIKELGQILASIDDPYICVAKRYYQYFTGLDVYVGDPLGQSFTQEHAFHRLQVQKLASNLKKNQSTLELIKSILQLPHYQTSDFTQIGK